jgi:hypothetical protein
MGINKRECNGLKLNNGHESRNLVRDDTEGAAL